MVNLGRAPKGCFAYQEANRPGFFLVTIPHIAHANNVVVKHNSPQIRLVSVISAVLVGSLKFHLVHVPLCASVASCSTTCGCFLHIMFISCVIKSSIK